jgi:hypothetical protein
MDQLGYGTQFPKGMSHLHHLPYDLTMVMDNFHVLLTSGLPLVDLQRVLRDRTKMSLYSQRRVDDVLERHMDVDGTSQLVQNVPFTRTNCKYDRTHVPQALLDIFPADQAIILARNSDVIRNIDQHKQFLPKVRALVDQLSPLCTDSHEQVTRFLGIKGLPTRITDDDFLTDLMTTLTDVHAPFPLLVRILTKDTIRNLGTTRLLFRRLCSVFDAEVAVRLICNTVYVKHRDQIPDTDIHGLLATTGGPGSGQYQLILYMLGDVTFLRHFRHDTVRHQLQSFLMADEWNIAYAKDLFRSTCFVKGLPETWATFHSLSSDMGKGSATLLCTNFQFMQKHRELGQVLYDHRLSGVSDGVATLLLSTPCTTKYHDHPYVQKVLNDPGMIHVLCNPSFLKHLVVGTLQTDREELWEELQRLVGRPNVIRLFAHTAFCNNLVHDRRGTVDTLRQIVADCGADVATVLAQSTYTYGDSAPFLLDYFRELSRRYGPKLASTMFQNRTLLSRLTNDQLRLDGCMSDLREEFADPIVATVFATPLILQTDNEKDYSRLKAVIRLLSTHTDEYSVSTILARNTHRVSFLELSRKMVPDMPPETFDHTIATMRSDELIFDITRFRESLLPTLDTNTKKRHIQNT